ncbi:ATP-binding cassette domain-containing protein [Heliobacterium gestii]|uniref:ATP-binding cassette domain-containing protein n=1 Tax=Heliomicrobium gestii TaxID=2699 RepID=A0A845LDI8_HELGE|nr:ABC transporter ATP-binding protein [Heliomicrobium gestii]MBM7865352.1 NitT/TauT family transport system ATP-binding protein [Heliomicrobium gestii]MZP41613.1 ATP-binding cassette domain-containing protein [Heliomicrobium gestii]
MKVEEKQTGVEGEQGRAEGAGKEQPHVDTEPAVRLRDVSVTYQTPKGEIPALAGVDLDIAAGDFVAIVGPSGCGKSTILSLIAGLFAPTSGEVFVGGKAAGLHSARVGYMLQQDFLLPWRTVRDNARLGLELLGEGHQEQEKRVDRLLETYGLGHFLQHHPRELSGGMRQRVALVRTLAVEPEIFLLDEPFSALDYQTRTAIQEEVWRALRASKRTIILVTHDVVEAVAMSDRVIVLSSRPARIQRELPIDFGPERPGPWQARKAAGFHEYVDTLWDELKVYVDREREKGG